jgi:hypothetical protein
LFTISLNIKNYISFMNPSKKKRLKKTLWAHARVSSQILIKRFFLELYTVSWYFILI